MIFWCIYSGEGRGCTYAYLSMGTYRTSWLIFMKLGRNEVLMVPHKYAGVSVRNIQRRIKGWAKIGHEWSPYQKNSSSDRKQGHIYHWLWPCRKATATHQMHSNNLEAFVMKCCWQLFLVPFWIWSLLFDTFWCGIGRYNEIVYNIANL